MSLHPFFERAVQEQNRRTTALLGDRTQYIGSSDVAGCARKVYMQRRYPLQPDVNVLLKFARGHAAEWLLDSIFTAGGAVYDTQVELCHPVEPMRAHLDFLFYQDFDGNPGLHAIEVKSVSGIPDAPYPQWEDQLAYQLGLLRLQYPKGEVTGSILAIDLNAGEVEQFTGYLHDEATFNYIFCRGLHLLDVMSGKSEPQPSPSVLCGYCQYRDDCPSRRCQSVELPPEIDSMVSRYAKLNTTKSQAEKELKSLRLAITDFTGVTSFKGRNDRFDLIVSSVASSMTVDANLLRAQYPDIYPKVLKPRAGYSKLEVKELKKPPRLAA